MKLARAIIVCALLSLPAAAQSSTTAYVNGNWFDGSRFVQRTMYVIGDRFSFHRPASVGETVDLRGGYVVPPFGEAHNHNVEPLNNLPKLIATYLEHGIFYVKNPNNLPRDRQAVAPLVNRLDSIDVIFSNGGWTSSGGHPAEIAKRVIDRHLWREEDGDGGFFWTAATPAEVDQKWSAYIAQEPEFVKIYLLFADDAARQQQPEKYFGWKGVTPAVARAIVDRAHSAHLRVSAHIESASDFHEALMAGVDEINHMPGFRIVGDVDQHPASDFEISAADAELAYKRHVTVVTTLGGAMQREGTARAEQDRLNKQNLQLLLKHQVRVVLGSDSYREDTLPEALHIHSLRAMSDAKLLRMWTTETAQAIFPGRELGLLREGYEASFLVLSGDPLQDFSNVTRITRRVKQGHVLP
jgi:hypothetical protein